MSEADLDALLDRMPKIAAAVGQFASESIQSEVFQALMRAFGNIGDPRALAELEVLPEQPTNVSPRVETEPATKKTAGRRSVGTKTKQSFSIDKELDLVKGGSQPFTEFAESKKPTSQQEKCLVSVYWLTHLSHSKKLVTLEQVYTCFKHAGWAVPANLPNALAQAGSKGWLDSKNRNDLKLVVQGENHIEHSMPAQPKST